VTAPEDFQNAGVNKVSQRIHNSRFYNETRIFSFGETFEILKFEI